MHRTLSWRNCSYIYMLKNPSQDQIPPCHAVILFAGYSVRKGPSKSKVQKKQRKDLEKTDIILRTQFPAWLDKTAFPVPSVYSTVQFLSDIFSPPLGRSRTTRRRMEENASTSITERLHTYMLSYRGNMYAVLQGWEHSTGASLSKDAKSAQVRHQNYQP